MRSDVVLIDSDDLRKFHPSVSDWHGTHPYTLSGLTYPEASQWLRQFEANAKKATLGATLGGEERLVKNASV